MPNQLLHLSIHLLLHNHLLIYQLLHLGSENIALSRYSTLWSSNKSRNYWHTERLRYLWCSELRNWLRLHICRLLGQIEILQLCLNFWNFRLRLRFGQRLRYRLGNFLNWNRFLLFGSRSVLQSLGSIGSLSEEIISFLLFRLIFIDFVGLRMIVFT